MRLLVLLVALCASPALAQVLEADIPPFDVAPPSLPAAGDDPFMLGRVFGHLNVVGSQHDARDGIGYFDPPEEVPQDGIIYITRLAGNPQPYDEVTPRGGTIGPDGRFFFIGTPAGDSTSHTLYTLDFRAPEAGYTPVASGIDAGFLAPDGELAVGMGYDFDAGRAVLMTRLCGEVAGTYYQSFLYDIDLATGALSGRRELRDPAAPTAENAGVCLFSASWDGSTIFGADAGGDILQVDAETGLVAGRFNPNPGGTVERVQSSAYDFEEEAHYVFAFVVERDDQGEITFAYTRAYRCAPDEGCEFRGFVADDTPSGVVSVEVLTATFLPAQLVASEAGTPPADAALHVYPNPTAGAAAVTLRLAGPEAVTVTLHDLLGRTVATLHDGLAADLALRLDGAALPAGVYFVRVRGESFSATRKVVVTR